jgi:arylsulfatase A-like enzyme
VIVFFTDQQRWDTVGLHGNPLDLTPNLDRAAKGGTHLFNSFTPQPVCGPARSCLQTGLYPTRTGCYKNDIPLPQRATTLAHRFRRAGYDTAHIGKWHLAGSEPSSIRVPVVPLGPGFRGGGSVEQLVSLLDLPPTLLDAAGLPIPEEMQGRSVLALLNGDREGWPEEVFVQISESQVGRAIRTRRSKYCVVAPEADALKQHLISRMVEIGEPKPIVETPKSVP